MTCTHTGSTENNDVQTEQLKPHFLVKNTTISKIKCTIEIFPKEKHTINKNTFLWSKENSKLLFFPSQCNSTQKSVTELHSSTPFPGHAKGVHRAERSVWASCLNWRHFYTRCHTPDHLPQRIQYFLHCGQTWTRSAASLLLTHHGGKVRSLECYFSSNKIILSACFINWQKMFLKCFSNSTVYRIEKPFIRIKGLASVAASLSGHSSPLPEDWMICDTGLPHFISAIKRWTLWKCQGHFCCTWFRSSPNFSNRSSTHFTFFIQSWTISSCPKSSFFFCTDDI